jgi:antitoxin YefM
VLLSEEEFEGWKETMHLLRNPTNAARLLRSIGQARAGSALEREVGKIGSGHHIDVPVPLLMF